MNHFKRTSGPILPTGYDYDRIWWCIIWCRVAEMMITAALLLASLAVQPTEIKIDLDKPTVTVSPTQYGVFFEEINRAGEGGIYGELLRNRGFEAPPAGKDFEGWHLAARGGSSDFVTTQKLNAARKFSLELTSKDSTEGGIATNNGFWGIPLKKGQPLKLSLWAKGTGKLLVNLGAEGQEPIAIEIHLTPD